jgi:DNA-binding transcriptional ArsR family regulator
VGKRDLLNLRTRTKALSAGEREAFLVFPMLAALAKRAMNMNELCRLLYIHRATAGRRLRELERKGWVVQRRDGRWVVVVRLRVEGVLRPTGVPGIDPVLGCEPGEVGHDPAADVLPAAVDAQEKRPIAEVVEATKTPQTASQKVAAKFGVPWVLDGLGSLSISTVGGCSLCSRPTMLRYGSDRVCPGCARNQAVVFAGQLVEN